MMIVEEGLGIGGRRLEIAAISFLQKELPPVCVV
jgi:hypothetical protein